MRKNGLGIYKALLVFLITTLAITGISVLDNQIWNIVLLVIGMLAYSIVGMLFSIGLIRGVQAGREMYALVFILLLGLGYCVYQGIVSLQLWVLSWPLFVKIIVPSIIVVLTIGIIILIVSSTKKLKESKR